ncbi:MAG: polysaccharide export protein [Alphaproteobacteria bacterium]|nr:polysaccharide export protein [Alphaproteobacteria bacterium]
MVARKGLFLFVFLCGLSFAPSCLFAASPSRPLSMQGQNASSLSPAYQQQSPSTVVPSISASGSSDYVLDVGDKIRLTVYGEADLSGEYEVSSTGVVSLPLIGTIPAAHRNIHDFEQAVTSKLTEGYLRDPRVSAQVINYRPFFILGEVSKPGSYPYVNGMTVVNAVAMAGGYTYRADKSEVTITRANDKDKQDTQVSEEERVMPGDVLRIPERFF